jgi:hypothetical protein
MERVQTRDDLGPVKKRKATRGVVNRAFVVKDRADILDGVTIDNPTFKDFLPHFEALNIGGSHRTSDAGESSSGLFDKEGRSDWQREKLAREKWSEEIQGILTAYYPGQSAEEKKKKANILYAAFNTRSWTAITDMNSEVIKMGFEAIKKVLEEGEKDG